MENETPKHVCMTVAGLDPSGGAGIIADVKTFRAFGCFATAVVTSLTYQNTTGVFGAVHQTAESVRGQAEPVIDDFPIDAVKTGMLPTSEVIDETASIIREHGLRNIVVDPVVRSTSGHDLIDAAALRALIRELFPLADLITPNIPEAERIAQIEIGGSDDIDRAAKIMNELGARNVLIKGGHAGFGNGERRVATDYLYLGGERESFDADLIDTTSTHGTGCTLSAAITANLALGHGISGAVRIAKTFVTEAIRTAPELGRGNSPINV